MASCNSWQYLLTILAKIFPRSCQDLTKISIEGRPGLSSTFIKLLARIIKVLAAISSREFPQVSLCIGSYFSCSWDVNNFTAILMQINFIHNVNNKLASSPKSYLRSGDSIRWVVEKIKCEDNVIRKKGELFFKFNCRSGKCGPILQDLQQKPYWIFKVLWKITLHAGLQHVQSFSSLN